MQEIGNRLYKRRKELNKTQSQLARSIGVSNVTISTWENDPSSPPNRYEHIIGLCKALNCTPEWLIYGKNNPAVSNGRPGPPRPEIHTEIPLLSSVQAGDWTEVCDGFERSDADSWRETTARVGPRAFALRVTGESMENPRGLPTIPEESIVIVDPDIPADNGRIVVAMLDDSSEATIKKLVIDGPNRYLVPLNPRYDPIKINGNCRIVGVVKKVEIDL